MGGASNNAHLAAQGTRFLFLAHVAAARQGQAGTAGSIDVATSVTTSLTRQLDDFRELLRIRDYQRLWAAQVISAFGDRFTQIALATLIFTMTGSRVGIGVVLALGVLPEAGLGIVAGVAADRFSRRTLLIATDLLRAAVVLVLGLWTGLPAALVYALALVHSSATVFFTPTRYALLPEVVGRERLLAANALDETSQNSLDPLAYLVAGGLLVAVGMRATFAVDSVTFLVSAAIISGTVLPLLQRTRQSLPETRAHTGASGGAMEGLRFIWRDPTLRANTMLVMLATLVASCEYPLSYMMVFSHWQKGPFGLGVMEAALALGIVGGGLACRAAVASLGRGPTILVGLAGTGVTMTAIAFLPFSLAILVVAASGVSNAWYFLPMMTLQQELAPDAIRARVLGSRRMLTAITIFVSYVTATVLARTTSPAVLMGVAGLALLSIALGGFLFPELRRR